MKTNPGEQHGAALLSAMLTVTLVATFAAAALWQQWRSVEVEAAERARVQSVWILTGALDWARLILRADRIGGQKTDHLGEPWAVPLEESRLSSFLAADRNNSGGQTNDEAFDAFLSGRIFDLQARLNVNNLIESGKVSQPWRDTFAALFQLLGLPEAELGALAESLRRAAPLRDSADAAAAPIAPQRVAQLVHYGLSPATLLVLEPYIALLPTRPVKININTASAVVLAASEPLLSLADAERLVAARASRFFRAINDASGVLGAREPLFARDLHDVESSFFEVRGRLRLESITLEERSLVRREGYGYAALVKTLLRERLSFDDRAMPDPGAQAAGTSARP